MKGLASRFTKRKTTAPVEQPKATGLAKWEILAQQEKEEREKKKNEEKKKEKKGSTTKGGTTAKSPTNTTMHRRKGSLDGKEQITHESKEEPARVLRRTESEGENQMKIGNNPPLSTGEVIQILEL